MIAALGFGNELLHDDEDHGAGGHTEQDGHDHAAQGGQEGGHQDADDGGGGFGQAGPEAPP